MADSHGSAVWQRKGIQVLPWHIMGRVQGNPIVLCYLEFSTVGLSNPKFFIYLCFCVTDVRSPHLAWQLWQVSLDCPLLVYIQQSDQIQAGFVSRRDSPGYSLQYSHDNTLQDCSRITGLHMAPAVTVLSVCHCCLWQQLENILLSEVSLPPSLGNSFFIPPILLPSLV